VAAAGRADSHTMTGGILESLNAGGLVHDRLKGQVAEQVTSVLLAQVAPGVVALGSDPCSGERLDQLKDTAAAGRSRSQSFNGG